MTATGSTWDRLLRWPENVQRAYADGADRPLRGYLGLLSIYSAGTLSAVAAGKLRGSRLPDRVSIGDLLLIGLGTHKMSRMIAKDPVLSPVRAPFTRFKGTSGEAELSEEVRGKGLQHAAGELLTCPFCLAQWIATALTASLVLFPRATRVVAATFTAKAISDLAQLLYDAAQRQTESISAPS